MQYEACVRSLLPSARKSWLRQLSLPLLFVVSTAWFFGAQDVIAQEPSFEKMLSRAPADTNVVVMIDIEKLMATPLAKKEGWFDRTVKSASIRPLFAAPGVQRIARASLLNLSTLSPITEVAFLSMKEIPTNLAAVAKKHDGYVDKVRGTNVVWLPRGAYLVPLDSHSVSSN